MGVSVVLPAYNEEAGIEECLVRLVEQGPAVTEVVVVDNNSSDRTAELVGNLSRLHPKIRLISETTPGVSYARYTGFNSAVEDIIVSIDADTIVLDGWVASIEAMFEAHPDIAAGGAPMNIHDLPLQNVYQIIHRKIMKSAEHAANRGRPLKLLALSGANSVVTRSAWESIRDSVSYRRDIFEDLDRSLHLTRAGHEIVIIPGMNATVSGRRFLSSPMEFLRYAACGPRTYRLHHRSAMAAVVSVVIGLDLIRHVVMLPAYRAWDDTTKSYSLRNMFREHKAESPIKSGLD